MPKLKNPNRLTRRQEEFLEKYFLTNNATQSYKDVFNPDMKDGTAGVLAHNLLKSDKISQRLQSLREEKSKEFDIDAKKLLTRLSAIAFGHLGLVCDWDDYGELTIKKKDTLKDEEIATIDSLEYSPVVAEGEIIGRKTRIKMRDSIRAAEVLLKHLGLLDKGKASDGNEATSQLIGQRILQALSEASKEK